MKRLINFFLSITLCISLTGVKVYAKDSEPTVSADSAVLMDAETGTVLYSKNMNNAYPPASTTKVMTTLLTLEKTKMDDVVTVGKKVPYVEGSKIGIAEGEEIKVKDLLYGLILMSGNDCAEALAEHIGGSLEGFAAMMNQKAKELGCENTNFANPSGLYDSNHKTSAKDLALIMREAAKYSEYRDIASTFAYKIPATNKHPEGINLGNENKLLNKNSKYYYPGAEAGKTGYTVQSLHSYVASANKNGQRLIVALVHDKEKMFYEDTKKLFDYGFKNFELVKLYSKGDIVDTITDGDLKVPLTASDNYFYVKEKGSLDTPKMDIEKVVLTDKSFKIGDKLTEASMTLEDKKLPKLQLQSGVDHEIKSIFNSTVAASKSENKNIIYLFGAFLGLSIIVIAAILKKSRKRRSIYK
ncbi:D-alanyl-D-alanine carboxypeptidase [Clostridium swellfunianum]|uniref:D-alanyl-D-alanine carboxypeptidase family protein n=1 Tax=Clostridium swellfunianum TaxID=1367462 RepID=UPI0020302803|nr:D-alanyl-D-alanine carboxypeptidase family protein [Clostridium swellfunianum]MCM0648940.1 D-alanyl-D-alanine carboxypeptidase [Clostridium swellfunianum]